MVLVSAIVTTCKRDPHIVERALKSVLSQTYRNIEIIVVDDSPREYPLRLKVKSMIEAYNDGAMRIEYAMHEENRGACVARNTGVALSHGTIVGFLDDDDEWLPNKVESMIKKFDDQKVALVYGDTIYCDDDRAKRIIEKRPKHRGMVYDKLIWKNFIGSTSFPLIRKDPLVLVGGFDELMQSAQDVELYLRLSQSYEIDYVDEVIAIYHGSKSERISNNVDKINL